MAQGLRVSSSRELIRARSKKITNKNRDAYFYNVVQQRPINKIQKNTYIHKASSQHSPRMLYSFITSFITFTASYLSSEIDNKKWFNITLYFFVCYLPFSSYIMTMHHCSRACFVSSIGTNAFYYKRNWNDTMMRN